jgi:hypothetical protein
MTRSRWIVRAGLIDRDKTPGRSAQSAGARDDDPPALAFTTGDLARIP